MNSTESSFSRNVKISEFPGEIVTNDTNRYEIGAYVPQSFWHKQGAYWASRKLLNRGIPDCKGAKFITFTVAGRDEAWGSAEQCYDELHKQPAYAIAELKRLGYRIHGYIMKLELHEDGYPHWHAIVWNDGRIELEHLNKSWRFGYVNIKGAYTQEALIYTLKYSFKGSEPPEWVRERSRIQVCRKSQKFYDTMQAAGYEVLPFPDVKKFQKAKKKSPRSFATIGERIESWRYMSKVTQFIDGEKRHTVLKLKEQFASVFNEMLQFPSREWYGITNQKIEIRKEHDYTNLSKAIISESAHRERGAERRWFNFPRLSFEEFEIGRKIWHRHRWESVSLC